MAYLTEKQFDFRSSALPEDTFGVVDFKGFEGFSKPYEFEIMLVSSDPEIDMTEVLQNPAVFTIMREEGDIPFNGILAQFEQLHAVVDHVFYRAVLVPRFWWLSLTQHNQIFLDKTVPEIIGEVLEDGGLTTDDYELRISNDYPKWEYICQYRESHQSFVSRWMEREGMYYFFEQTEKGEKLIITDSNMSHTPMDEGKTMYYSPPSGLEEAHREEVIRAVVCKQKLLPAKLHVNDYNYRKPSLSLSAEAKVLDRGRGDVHIYGEHFRTPEEGQDLARIRAEELLCHEKRFHGESTIPFLRTGYLFELQNHYRESFNQQYLTIELEHEGSQVGYLLAGIQEGLAKVEGQPYYRNSFVTIPSGVQYRHPKTTEKPSFNGTINARIDAEGSGEYAELDDQGRYKVRLPFDLSGRNDGRASHWLRMAQPYAGTDHGMHFPLHKGTEVLLTFVEGDPDRPIIASAIPNPETASPVTAANQSESVIQTGGNNKIRIEDLAGSERIIMETPAANSWMRMGTPNDPGKFVRDRMPGEGIRIYTEGELIEESNDNQTVELDATYVDLDTFNLNTDTYDSIDKDIDKEIAHIAENIRRLDIFLGTPDPDTGVVMTDPDGELTQETNLEVVAQYNLAKIALETTKTQIVNFQDNAATTLDPIITATNNSAPHVESAKGTFIEKLELETFSTDENANDIIVSVILRNTINEEAKHRSIEISGDQINETKGSHKITAIDGNRRIEMTDQGIYIDAGEDRDITLKCRNFYLKNKDEDNITYGSDYAEHYGPNEEKFYGTDTKDFYGESIETFHGKKTEMHYGDIDEGHIGNKFEHYFSATESFHASEHLELHAGFMQEAFIGLHHSFSFLQDFEFFLGLKSEIFLGVKYEACAGWEIKNGSLGEIKSKPLRIIMAGLSIL